LRAQEPDPDAPSPSGALPLYSDRAARSRMTRPTQHEFAGWSGEFAGKSGSQIDAPIRAIRPPASPPAPALSATRASVANLLWSSSTRIVCPPGSDKRNNAGQTARRQLR
jgi:hypothetical protein